MGQNTDKNAAAAGEVEIVMCPACDSQIVGQLGCQSRCSFTSKQLHHFLISQHSSCFFFQDADPDEDALDFPQKRYHI